MTTTQRLVLDCLQHNLDRAASKPMRKFCSEQLENYQKSLARKYQRKPTPPPAFTRFLSHFD